VCSFAVASHRYFKQDEEYQEEASYFDVTVWNRLAEVCGQYLSKGRGVRVVGKEASDGAKAAPAVVDLIVECVVQIKNDGCYHDSSVVSVIA